MSKNHPHHDGEHLSCTVSHNPPMDKASFHGPVRSTMGPRADTREAASHVSTFHRDQFLPIDPNNLRDSLETFCLQLDLNQVLADSERLRAALVAFPQATMQTFLCRYGRSELSFKKFQDFIKITSPQLFACHKSSAWARTPGVAELEALAEQSVNCPHDELVKHFMWLHCPRWAQREAYEAIDLPLCSFKRRLLTLLDKEGTATAPVYSSHLNSRPPMGREAHEPRTRPSCSYHAKYGKKAFRCEGPICPLYPPTGAPPVCSQVDTADQAATVATTKSPHLSVASAVVAIPESQKRGKRSCKRRRYKQNRRRESPAPRTVKPSIPPPQTSQHQTVKMTTPPPPSAEPEMVETMTPQPPLHSPLNAAAQLHLHPPPQLQGHRMAKGWCLPTTNFEAASTTFKLPLSPLALNPLHGKWKFFNFSQHFNSSLCHQANHPWQACQYGWMSPTVC